MSKQYSRVNIKIDRLFCAIPHQKICFIYGSEFGTNLTLIDGTGSLYPSEHVGMVSYDRWDSYFDGTNSLVVNGEPVFDVIFINCGNEFKDEILRDPDGVTLLQQYVNAGGRLYATDLQFAVTLRVVAC